MDIELNKIVTGIKFDSEHKAHEHFFMLKHQEITLYRNKVEYRTPFFGIITEIGSDVKIVEIGDIIVFPVPSRPSSVTEENADRDLDGEKYGDDKFFIHEDDILMIIKSKTINRPKMTIQRQKVNVA